MKVKCQAVINLGSQSGVKFTPVAPEMSEVLDAFLSHPIPAHAKLVKTEDEVVYHASYGDSIKTKIVKFTFEWYEERDAE